MKLGEICPVAVVAENGRGAQVPLLLAAEAHVRKRFPEQRRRLRGQRFAKFQGFPEQLCFPLARGKQELFLILKS